MAEKISLFSFPHNADVDSFPMDQNFSKLLVAFNALVDEVNNLSISTSTSEIISARESFPTFKDRLVTTQKLLGDGVISDETLLLDCEDTTDLTESFGGTPPELDNKNFIEGSGSLKLGKSSDVVSDVAYESNSLGINFRNKIITFHIFIEDEETLNKLKTGEQIYFDITSDNKFEVNYKRFVIFKQKVSFYGMESNPN